MMIQTVSSKITGKDITVSFGRNFNEEVEIAFWKPRPGAPMGDLIESVTLADHQRAEVMRFLEEVQP